MKYLKLYENFIQSDSEIHKLCEEYGITNYTINNGLVDVDGDVDLSDKGLTKLPIKFGRISDTFQCYNNQLTSFDGAPKEVGGNFYCYNNKLTTLEGSPLKVGGNFYCINCKLTSLDGSPKYIGGDFDFGFNQLTSLKGAEETISKNIICTNNNIYKLDFVPNYKQGFGISGNPFHIIWRLIKHSIEKDYTLFNHFIENNIFRDPGYQGDTTGLPIIILDRLNDFLDMCKLPNVEEVEGYTCI